MIVAFSRKENILFGCRCTLEVLEAMFQLASIEVGVRSSQGHCGMIVASSVQACQSSVLHVPMCLWDGEALLEKDFNLLACYASCKHPHSVSLSDLNQDPLGLSEGLEPTGAQDGSSPAELDDGPQPVVEMVEVGGYRREARSFLDMVIGSLGYGLQTFINDGYHVCAAIRRFMDGPCDLRS